MIYNLVIFYILIKIHILIILNVLKDYKIIIFYQVDMMDLLNYLILEYIKKHNYNLIIKHKFNGLIYFHQILILLLVDKKKLRVGILDILINLFFKILVVKKLLHVYVYYQMVQE